MPVDTPVGEVVSGSLTTVGADAAGADVMLAMLDNNVRHVGVLSPRGELLGVLGGIDLVAAEARTPFALRREIAQARDKEELSEAAQRLRSTVVALHTTKLPPQQIGRIISVVADADPAHDQLAIGRRAQRRRVAFLRWAATADGRRCHLPTSTREWRGRTKPSRVSGSAIASDDVLRYMREIAGDMEDCIRVVGEPRSPRRHGVSEFSASSMDTWRRSIGNWLKNPANPQVLIATSILLDGRTVYGPPS
jgi:CBS domain-containing protein